MMRGVDGCRAGWLAISVDAPGGHPESRVFPDAPAMFQDGRAEITAIDIPIGLPTHGARECDVEARRIIGARRSSVFPTPLRRTLVAESYELACAAALDASGKKLSKQTFAILPKIRQIDDLLRTDPARAATVHEVHPEVSFTLWNQGRPMEFPKHSGFGFAERLRLVENQFRGAAEQVRRAHTTKDVSDDDILDAFAALWTALRIRSSTAVRIGPQDATDECGLPMCMWA